MRTLSAIAAVVALASASLVNGAVEYTVSSLGGLGGTSGSKGSAISGTGLVVGTAFTAGNAALGGLSYMDNAGVVTRVTYGPLGGGENSFGMGVGGAGGGTMVGFSQTTDRAVHAITGTGGVVTNLHTTAIVPSAGFGAATGSRAFGINGAGAVVGHAKVGSAYQAFYLPSGGPAVAIGALAGQTDGLATAVNDGGTVVGFSYTGDWVYNFGGSIANGAVAPTAWAWEAGTLTGLGTLGGEASIATAVNSAGQIVGQSTVLAGDLLATRGRAFVYDNGVMSPLTNLAGTVMSIANDINDTGLIVGAAKLPSGQRAFVYANGAMTDLNTLLGPGSGWVLREATSINDDGYITGWGTYGGQTTAFLLSPIGQGSIPEPATAGLLAVGAIVMAGWRRR